MAFAYLNLLFLSMHIRLKTWLRSQMGQESWELVGLALLHVHRDFDLSIENIINRFANMKNRNLDFIL